MADGQTAAERCRQCGRPTDQTAAEILTEVDALIGCEDEYPLGEIPDRLRRRIAEAVAAEREACAGAVDELCDDVDDPFMYGTLRAVAAAIRNRGEADRD